MNPETKLQAAIVERLKLCCPHLDLDRNNTGAIKGGRYRFGLGGKGGADLVGVLGPHGRYVALEVKLPGKDAEPHQAEWLRRKWARGALVAVVHSPDEAVETVQRWEGELRVYD